MRPRTTALACLLAVTALAAARAAERVTLHPGNYAAYAPAGKETDAIFGDYVLRNDRLTAVIADPALCRGRSSGRKNGPIPQGLVIDLTRRDRPNDLLLQFDPTFTESLSRRESQPQGDPGEPTKQAYCIDESLRWKEPARKPLSAPSVTLALPFESPVREVRYTLEDGADFLLVETVYDAAAVKALTPPFMPSSALYMGFDALATSEQFVHGDSEDGRLVWMVDPWYGQAYGVAADGYKHRPAFAGNRPAVLYQRPEGTGTVGKAEGGTITIRRRIFAASDLFELRRLVNEADGIPAKPLTVTVTAPDGPVAGAPVSAFAGKRLYGLGLTDAAGKLTCSLPERGYRLVVEPRGRKKQELEINPASSPAVTVSCEPAARAVLTVTDGESKPLPCKVRFQGIEGTADPFFFPATGSNRVRNVAFTADGRIEQILAPGRYRITITRGPEYSTIQRDIQLGEGQSTSLTVRLERVLDTTGWISATFGSRTTQSRGFSISDVKGRVLGLAAEHIEFAPAGERDHVFTYENTIRELGLEPFLKSCAGIGLTERVRKGVTSQNAFPVKYVPGAQDGGAVQRPQHIYQVFWLNGWYGPLTAVGNAGYTSSWDKLIQVTPPGIHENDGKWHGMWSLFQDVTLPHSSRNGIEQVHRNSRMAELRLYQAMEVQPLESFLKLPAFDPADPDGARDVAAWQKEMNEWSRKKDWPSLAEPNLLWLRMLNMGYRITGVVNNNGYSNYESSGRYRSYVRIGQDDPAKIDPLAVVEAVRKGRVVMSTGPILDVTAEAGGKTAGLGEDLACPEGKALLKVRVQAAAPTMINTVRVLFNGRPVPALTRTRAANADLFRDGPVQFDSILPLEMTADTRIMVLADGLSGTNSKAVALSNPIYLDVGGDGFRPFPPWQDRVFTRMDEAVPLMSASGAKPGEVVLKLKNLGTSPAADTFTLSLLPEGAAEVIGTNRWSYRLEPGAVAEYRIPLRLTGTAKSVRAGVARSSAGTGRRAVALTLDVDKKNAGPSTRSPESDWWLPRNDPEQPPSWMWPEAGR